MSIILDRLTVQSATMYPATVPLSPMSVTVLLFSSGFLEHKRNWLDQIEDPLDEITDADWDKIEKIVANAYEEIMTPIVGYIFPYMTTNPPDNCLTCDGSSYAREDYPVLYSLLDAAFVLDADTFFVPDLRSRVPVGAGTGTGLSTYAVNQAGGEENHTLTTLEMPSHTHVYQPPGTTGLAVAPGELPVILPALLPTQTGSAGGDGAHNNIQPYVALNYAVVAL